LPTRYALISQNNPEFPPPLDDFFSNIHSRFIMASSKIRGDETMPATYPTAVKRQVIQRYEKGESIKSLSQELLISQSTIYHWRKLYCSIQTAQRIYNAKRA
jgi:hypothetical protein